MSNSGSESLNVVLGQIEDELNRVRSARDQVESVLDANAALKELVGLCGEQSKSSADALVAEAGRLAGLSEMIEQAALEGVEAIKRQTSDAREAIAASSDEVAGRVSAEAERLVELAKEMEHSSAETSEAVRAQASQAQETLQGVAESAVERASSALSESAQKAMGCLNDGIDEAKRGLDEAKRGVDTALESLGESASALDQSRLSLVEAHESASSELMRQSEQTRELLDATQRQLEVIDAKIIDLTSIDIEGLSKEVQKLKEAEESNAAQLRQQVRNLMVMVAVCIAVCLAVLAKSLLT